MKNQYQNPPNIQLPLENTQHGSLQHGYGYGYGYRGRAAKGGGVGLRMEMFFRFLNTKAFLLNAAFVGFLLASSVVIDSGGQTLWEMQNSGKTFEDAMETIEKAKKFKDKT